MKIEKYTVDFTNVKHYFEMHFEIARGLEFPDYYCFNWDAFWDCLTEMVGSPMHIEIIGLDVIRRKFDDSADKIIKLLKKMKHYCNDMFADITKIEIVEDGKRTEIE